MERNSNHLKYTNRNYQYDSEHTESEQRNARVREGINGGDGIDGGDGLMPNNRSSDVEFANDQTSQSANMLSADHTDPWPLPCSPWPDFQWGSSDGKVFCASVTSAYDEAIHWKRNIFLLPSGNAGKSFIQEMTRLFECFCRRLDYGKCCFESQFRDANAAFTKTQQKK